MGKMAVLKLKYVNEYRDRQGRLRRYFRRGADRGSLPGEAGSAEFMAAYQAFLGDKPAPTLKVAGSLGLLITEFYASLRDNGGTMKLSEMIAQYGDDDVKYQKLDDCTATLSMNKKGTKAQFVTPETFGFDGFDKFGMIVWFDRERLARFLEDSRPAVTNGDGDSRDR